MTEVVNAQLPREARAQSLSYLDAQTAIKVRNSTGRGRIWRNETENSRCCRTLECSRFDTVPKVRKRQRRNYDETYNQATVTGHFRLEDRKLDIWFVQTFLVIVREMPVGQLAVQASAFQLS